MTAFLKASAQAMVLAALILAPAGCRKPETDDQAVAIVNSQPILWDDLALEMKMEPLPAVDADKADAARSEVLDELIDQALLIQEARRLGVALDREETTNQMQLARAGSTVEEFREGLEARGVEYGQWEKRFLRQVLVNELIRMKIRARIVIQREEVKDYYWEHLGEFRRRQKVKLRQVFCRRQDSARAALKEIQLGDPFAEVAKRYSQSPESAKGGDLGWLDSRDLPQAVAKAAFALKKGKMSGIVKSPYGFHILLAEDMEQEGNLKPEEAWPEIYEKLLSQKEQPLYQAMLAELRAKADIRRMALGARKDQEEEP